MSIVRTRVMGLLKNCISSSCKQFRQMNSCVYISFIVIPGVIVVITLLSTSDSYGFHATEEDEHFM